MSKLTVRTILLLSTLLLGSVNFVRAQGLSPYFGLGSAMDSAGTTNNATNACTAGQLFDDLTGICEPGPTMGGLFGVVGAQFMFKFKPHLGLDGEYAWHFGQAAYLPNAGLTMRPSFYDINAVWELRTGGDKRFIPFFEGGLGAAKVALYFNSANVLTGVAVPANPSFSSENYFQLHGAVGMKLYIKRSMFIKPQFDVHYVVHLTNQFGRSAVLQYMISVGYTFGAR